MPTALRALPPDRLQRDLRRWLNENSIPGVTLCKTAEWCEGRDEAPCSSAALHALLDASPLFDLLMGDPAGFADPPQC